MNDPSHTVLRAHAKINLGLSVLARETSGFHQIETIFCALELADELEFTPRDHGVRLRVEGPPERPGPPPDLGPDDNNLAVRAAYAFFRESRLPAAVGIRLVKRIPAAGGLGGGSSDAAATLIALNRLHREPLSAQRLLVLAASLGSDVPFFVAGSPLARAWGRGSRLLPLAPLPSAPVLLLAPPIGVETGQAYADLAAARASGYVCPPAVLPAALRDWSDLAESANDFEPVIFGRLPLLATMRDALEGTGALLARMTGSGSTVFGVYRDTATAARASAELTARFRDADVILTRTLDHEGAGRPS
jgi:4-diphosphocytidyl-2-C-methyl-D-erythritol kinase